MEWFHSWWKGITGAVRDFFVGPGGDVLKAALANAVRVATAEGMSLLVLAAQNHVAGRPMLTEKDWKRVSTDLQSYAWEQGIATTETVIDLAIGTAVAAVPQTNVPLIGATGVAKPRR